MIGTKTIVLENWRLLFIYKNKPFDIQATVPGNVEIDLLREGIIQDPLPPDTVRALQAFEGLDWTYETTLTPPPLKPGETIDLVFEGIDTVADIFLNDEKIHHCENMFIPHVLEVTSHLRPTENKLRVHIFSPERYARKFQPMAAHASREHRAGEAYLRKARHMWGWDNAPRLLSAGLWRPVSLVVQPPIRFTQVYAYTNKVFKDAASVGIDWTIATPDHDLTPYQGKAVFSFKGEVAYERIFPIEFTSGSLRRDLTLQNPKLWWPVGYGEPHLYNLELLLYKNDQLVASWASRFGIREIELTRTEVTDEQGKGEFVFKVNGEKIYIRGTNWKPLSPLHSQAPAKMQKALNLCLDLNCNMVRVWGGGVYEGHDFFDICDERGLLVWQDFMFGCEFPPQDNFFQKAVAEEAETIVKLLRNHPSLALWGGDNETDQAFFWGMLVPPKLLPSDNEITRKVLKRAVKHHDPYRDYLESSPYVSDEVAKLRWADPNVKLRLAPEQHLYLGKQIFLTECAAHFVSETGANLMSESAELVEPEISRAKRLWDQGEGLNSENFRDGCEAHQLDGYFVAWKKKTRKSLRYFFNRDFEVEPWRDLALAVNIVGGDYFKCAVEHFRIGKWRRTGVITWSLLDMWPMMFNASLVDSHFRKKMPYDWVRQSQQPFCLMIPPAQPGDGFIYGNNKFNLFAANDTPREVCGTFRLIQHISKNEKKEIRTGDFVVGPNRSESIGSLAFIETQSLILIEWTVHGKQNFNHFVTGHPPFDFETFRDWCGILDQIYRGT